MEKGSRIKAAREAKKLTQEELGTLCGTTKQTIFKYENNLVTNIPTDRLEKLAEILGVTPSYLMGWEDALLESVKEESESGRTQAKEDMYRTFGTDHSALDIRLLGDKAAVIYYKAMDQRAVPELTNIIQTVDRKDYREMEKLRILLQSYLRADVPIQEIVDTALKPYREDDSLNEELG